MERRRSDSCSLLFVATRKYINSSQLQSFLCSLLLRFSSINFSETSQLHCARNIIRDYRETPLLCGSLRILSTLPTSLARLQRTTREEFWRKRASSVAFLMQFLSVEEIIFIRDSFIA